MAKRLENTTLYALIAAGAKARAVVAAPLAARGLQSGDDAVLLALAGSGQTAERALGEALGLDPMRRRAIVDRLTAKQLVRVSAAGPELTAHVALTATGLETAAILDRHWRAAEAALIGALGRKKTTGLRKRLGRARRKLGA